MNAIAIPFVKSMQADRRRITPGSQVIREFQDFERGVRHGR
jgi:hypothetical protein